MEVKISPSILSADFADMASAVKRLSDGGADMIHCDVMDGHFVPNITFGSKMVADVRRVTPLSLDVHLMITDPAFYIPDFIKSGADIITFHLEAVTNPSVLLEKIHASGIRGGVVINPETPVGAITDDVAAVCDMILVMSVHPGFGGQKFIPESLEKLRALRAQLDRVNPRCDLEVDGGITFENVREAAECGANVIVAGNTIFREPDFAEAIGKLKLCAR